MLQAIERYMKQAIVDKVPSVSSSALVSSLVCSLGPGLGLGLGRLWGGAGLQLVVLWRGDGLAGRCVGVAGGH